jgi:SAM-dependent methyltransferase
MTYLKNRILHFLRKRWVAVKLLGVSTEFSPDLPRGPVRRILQRHGLGFGPDGKPSWWYASLDLRRNDQDDLTKSILRHILDRVPKDARMLATGCGTGWMIFWLAQKGFRRIEGFDVLPNVVEAAREIAALGKFDVKLWQADGFAPALTESYDLILALYWVYSAWAGNYENRSRAGEDREKLLTDLLAPYAPRLNSGGLMILELIDASADLLNPPSPLYPIRHSPEQVERCAAAHGLTVEQRLFNDTHGHLPRMAYFLRKR